MVTMAQSVANKCNTHTHVDRTHSDTHLHQHSYTVTQLVSDRFFILKAPEGGGTNRNTRRKHPTAYPPIGITH